MACRSSQPHGPADHIPSIRVYAHHPRHSVLTVLLLCLLWFYLSFSSQGRSILGKVCPFLAGSPRGFFPSFFPFTVDSVSTILSFVVVVVFSSSSVFLLDCGVDYEQTLPRVRRCTGRSRFSFSDLYKALSGVFVSLTLRSLWLFVFPLFGVISSLVFR